MSNNIHIRYNIVTADMSSFSTLTNETFTHTKKVYNIIRILYTNKIAETIRNSSDLMQII